MKKFICGIMAGIMVFSLTACGQSSTETAQTSDVKVADDQAEVAQNTQEEKAGNTPDMAIMFSIDLYSLLAMDAIADMDSFCTTAEDKDWLNGFYDGFMMNSRSGETTYGIPWQRSTIILYYNKEAFTEAGLDPEKAPATWDEMKE